VVGLLLVGHSADVVRGLVAMVEQAAPGVPVAGAGGLGGGRLGTNGLEVVTALRRVLAAATDGVLVLLDLGSASMALDIALDQVGAAAVGRLFVSEAAFVEGAVLGAIAAAGGGSLDEVAAAADAALTVPKRPRD
jgi:dihydroxyacetone kinase DhaKLM complex PTS-EIIA-like component DhaM